MATRDFLQVFPGAGVVTLADDGERVALEQELVAVSSQALQNRVHFLLSPLMPPGLGIYRGYLASTLWDQLNRKGAATVL